MTNVIEQILHPESEKQELRDQIVNLENLLEKAERERDEYLERSEGADDCIFEQRKLIEDLIDKNTDKETGKVSIKLSDLRHEIADRRKHRWRGEFDILGDIDGVLKHIELEKETIEVVKEVLPTTLDINGMIYKTI